MKIQQKIQKKPPVFGMRSVTEPFLFDIPCTQQNKGGR